MADKGISLIVTKGSETIEISQLVQKITWKGRKGSSSRTLKSFLSGNPNFWHEACELLILLLRKFGFPMVSPAVID